MLLFLTHSLEKPSVIAFSPNIVKTMTRSQVLALFFFFYQATLTVAVTDAHFEMMFNALSKFFFTFVFSFDFNMNTKSVFRRSHGHKKICLQPCEGNKSGL